MQETGPSSGSVLLPDISQGQPYGQDHYTIVFLNHRSLVLDSYLELFCTNYSINASRLPYFRSRFPLHLGRVDQT